MASNSQLRRRGAGASASARVRRAPGVSLRVAVLTVGTRGDVQPFVALGQYMQRRGHTVMVCTSRDFKGFVEGECAAAASLLRVQSCVRNPRAALRHKFWRTPSYCACLWVGSVPGHGLQYADCGLETVVQPPEWLTCTSFYQVCPCVHMQVFARPCATLTPILCRATDDPSDSGVHESVG